MRAGMLQVALAQKEYPIQLLLFVVFSAIQLVRVILLVLWCFSACIMSRVARRASTRWVFTLSCLFNQK